jgi:hypothetical protein
MQGTVNEEDNFVAVVETHGVGRYRVPSGPVVLLFGGYPLLITLLRCASHVYDRMRGPADAQYVSDYHTLVAAPAFLVISTIGPSATVLL